MDLALTAGRVPSSKLVVPGLCWFMSGRPRLELGRAEVADGRVTTVAIVEGLDELEHDRLGLPGRPERRSIDQLTLYRAEEALHESVVVTVAD